MEQRRETRSFKTELRMEQTAGKTFLIGRAASYGVMSHDLGGWREVIEPGAFDDALADSDLDCLHTLNHDPSKILGRTLSGTTKLTSDSRGLTYRTLLPDVSYARDAAELCKRGDLSQSSFAFRVDPNDEAWDETEDPENPGETVPLRTISRIAKLYDVATVSSPAYPQTAAGITDRSLPASMPAEVRTRVLQRAADSTDDVDPDDACQCDCPECGEDQHEECSNEDCRDQVCAEMDCPYASSRSLSGGRGDVETVLDELNENDYEQAEDPPSPAYAKAF